MVTSKKKVSKKKKNKGGEHDLDDLKQELELDEHKVPFEELYQERLQANPDTGLTAAEAQRRIERDGPNAFDPAKENT
ncbi:sodium/potassium-transporting ATPase subunit alpha-like isoform X3 [Oratosquilla oratoria]|uniref:sodium/potassium-transporting ATPase subunit alpha-like isoform X3 n=1 Tax=Oratosquilla oratoria TaxID=337810 RepID=UPI003F76325C